VRRGAVSRKGRQEIDGMTTAALSVDAREAGSACTDACRLGRPTRHASEVVRRYAIRTRVSATITISAIRSGVAER